MEKNCYVCGRKVKVGVNIGKGLYRHLRCRPGSSIWLRSEVSIRSVLRDFFVKGKENGHSAGD